VKLQEKDLSMPKLSAVKLQSLHDFLLETRTNMSEYHARKENMAWVATTIYLGGTLATMNVAIKDDHLLVSTALFRCGLVLLILLTAVLTYMFIGKQFGDRFTAALIIGACGEVLGELLDPSLKINDQSLRAQEWHQLDHSFIFPNILIERLNSRQVQANRRPKHFLASYSVIAIWTIACIVLVSLI
jgi:hypothetical protein